MIQASLNGHEKIVQTLLAKGVEIDHQMDNGVTALFAASYAGHAAIVQALLSRGANVHLRQNGGQAALAYAKTDEIRQLLRADGARLLENLL